MFQARDPCQAAADVDDHKIARCASAGQQLALFFVRQRPCGIILQIGRHMVVGMTLLISWRAVLSSYLTKALARGSFAERRVVLIGEPDEIDTSDGLHRLRRCGYQPIESFPVLETDFDADKGMGA